MADLDRITFNVWGYVEAVLDRGTANEKYVENLVGPVKLDEADNIDLAMMSLWASTLHPDFKIELQQIMEASDRIKQQLRDDEHEWVG